MINIPKYPERPHYESPSLVFFFPIADIQEEVYKRTSYLAKMRISDDIHNLDGIDNVNEDIERNALDRISLTSGEDFMFTEFLEEAAAETYDWVKAFGRNVKRAYQVVIEPKTEVIWENNGICMSINNKPLDISETPEIPATFTYSGTTMSALFVNRIDFKPFLTQMATFVFHLVGTETKANGKSEKKELATAQWNLSASEGSTGYKGGQSFTLPNSDSDGALTYSDMHVFLERTDTPTPHVLKLDTYIEYRYFMSATEYETALFIITNNCKSNEWTLYADNVDIDGRNNVVFTLDYPCNFDRNMIRTIERHFKEALVCYVIYRWLEYTKPDEADAWYDRFEEHAHNAQLQMNSEVKILKRPSMWY